MSTAVHGAANWLPNTVESTIINIMFTLLCIYDAHDYKVVPIYDYYAFKSQLLENLNLTAKETTCIVHSFYYWTTTTDKSFHLQTVVRFLLDAAKFCGEFEKLKVVLKEVAASYGKIVLFVDEIHTIVGVGLYF